MSSRRDDEAAVVQSLVDLTRRCSPASAAKQMRILAALEARPIQDGAVLRQFHDALCFMRASPDDAALLLVVEASLAAFRERLAVQPDGGAAPD